MIPICFLKWTMEIMSGQRETSKAIPQIYVSVQH